MINKKDGIKISGYRGTWGIIDSMIYHGIKYYLLEHETYGDETCYLLINSKGSVIAETLDDIETTIFDNLD